MSCFTLGSCTDWWVVLEPYAGCLQNTRSYAPLQMGKLRLRWGLPPQNLVTMGLDSFTVAPCWLKATAFPFAIITWPTLTFHTCCQQQGREHRVQHTVLNQAIRARRKEKRNNRKKRSCWSSRNGSWARLIRPNLRLLVLPIASQPWPRCAGLGRGNLSQQQEMMLLALTNPWWHGLIEWIYFIKHNLHHLFHPNY